MSKFIEIQGAFINTKYITRVYKNDNRSEFFPDENPNGAVYNIRICTVSGPKHGVNYPYHDGKLRDQVLEEIKSLISPVELKKIITKRERIVGKRILEEKLKKYTLRNYKLRAECLADVIDFITNDKNVVNSYSIKCIPEITDVELEFDSVFGYLQIIKILKEKEDSHVMFQTLQLLENYTGERDYTLE